MLHYIKNFDIDAVNFIDACAALTEAQRIIINDLVKNLKNNSLWNKFYAIYPVIGGIEATHKFNLKDPRDLDAAFRLQFLGAWTHASTQMKPETALADNYATTYLNPSLLGYNANDFHLSMYTRDGNIETDAAGRGSLGWYAANTGSCIIVNRTNYHFKFFRGTDTTNSGTTTGGAYHGLLIGSRIANNNNSTYLNGALLQNNTILNTGGFASKFMNLGRITAINGSIQPFSFASVGSGLTSDEQIILYNIIQAYQTSLGRQV